MSFVNFSSLTSKSTPSSFGHNLSPKEHFFDKVLNDWKQRDLTEDSSELGSGSFSTVYKVRQVALKVSSIKNHIERGVALNEIAILEKLTHVPHKTIVKLLDHRTDESNVFTVLELGGDKSLLDFAGKLSCSEIRFVIAQIVLALKFLEEQRVLHRDIKLDNMLINRKKRIKIIDFGFSVVLKENESRFTACGTPEYVSPEILNGKGYSWPSQWWALGVSLHAILFEEYPFYASTLIDILENVTSKIYSVDCSHPKYNEKLVKLTTSLLEKDPQKRASFKQVKQSDFFSGFRWRELENKLKTSG